MKHWFFSIIMMSAYLANSQEFGARIDSLRTVQLQNLQATAEALEVISPIVLRSGTAYEKCQCFELYGNTLSRLSAFKKAVSVLDQAIEFCREDKVSLAKVFNALGYNFDRLDDHTNALAYFIQTAETYDQLEDNPGLMKAYMNIVSVLGQQGSYEKVKQYIGKASELIPKVDNPVMIGQFYSNAASHFTEMGEKNPATLETALRYAETGLEHAKIHRLNPQLPNLYIVLSSIYWLRGDLPRALSFNNLYYEHRAYASIRANIIGALRYGDIYTAQGKFSKARTWYDSATLIIDEVGSVFYKATLEESKYNLYKKWGRTREALAALENQKILEDSIFFLEQDQKIAELEARFESERKAKEILELQENIAIKELESLKKNWIMLLVILVTLMVLIIFWFFYQRRLSHQKADLAIQEQQLLRSQMNPHFLFNSLASIQDLVIQNKSREAVKYLAKFGTLVRNILDSSKEEFIPLQQEIAMVEHFVTLENMRFDKQILLEVDLDETLNPELIKIPPMFIQPFIENAIKHGFATLEGGQIKLSFKLGQDSVNVSIQDNGVGYQENFTHESKKIHAINIIKERLQNIYGKSRGINVLSIRNAPHTSGTIVDFQLPFKTTFT